jgi:uncharacterized protein (TIGR03437 family)
VKVFAVLFIAFLAAAQTPPGTLVYFDEFNGAALDSAMWRVASGPGDPTQQTQGYYTPAACQVHDGSLHLVTGNQPIKGADGKTYPYTSCRIDSNFSFLYGHVEFRAQLPAGKGYWPALSIRTDSSKSPQNGEIDVIEGRGSNTQGVYSTIRYWSQGTQLGSACGVAGSVPQGNCTSGIAGIPPAATDLSAGYHVYAIDWSPAQVVWSLDSKPYFTTAAIQNHIAQAVTIDLAVGGTLDGATDQTTPFPAELAIDYVRVYQTTPAPAVISAASQIPGVAPESIATIFGVGLAASAMAATSLPLATTLAGTTVTVKDSAGATRSAPLYYVSPNQINLQIPLGTAATGNATITIGKQTVTAPVGSVAPSLFTVNSSGFGVAAATAVRIDAAGNQTPVAIFQCTATAACVSIPIDLGKPTDQIYVSLYGTGIRNRFDYSMQAGSVFIPLLYGGPQGASPGLDQVNFQLPAALRGMGEIPFALTVNGLAANPVTLNIAP